MKKALNRTSLGYGIGLFIGILGIITFLSTTKERSFYLDSPEIMLSLGDKITIIETNTWKLRKELAQKEVLDIAYSKNGKSVVLGNCSQNDVVKLEAENYCQESVILDSDRCPQEIAYSPDYKHVAASVVQRGLFMIEGAKKVNEPGIEGVTDLQFHPSGYELAVATKQDFQIWKTAPFKLSTKKDKYPVNCMTYNQDGKLVFVGLNDGWAVLDVGAGYKEVYKFKGEAVKAIAINYSKKLIGTIAGNKAIVYNAVNYSKVRELSYPIHRSVALANLKDIKFSGNGKWMAIGEQQNFVHFYTVTDWKEVKKFPIVGSLRTMAFQPPEPLEIQTSITNIYIVRHAEKDLNQGSDPHLTNVGIERAQTLVDTLKSKKIGLVFTTKYNRTYETAKPTADYFGLKPKYYDADTLTNFLKKTWGKNILVVTHSGTLSQLVQEFGVCTTFVDNEYTYDNFIVIRRSKGLNNQITTRLLETKYGEASGQRMPN